VLKNFKRAAPKRKRKKKKKNKKIKIVKKNSEVLASF
jgi:hypothetical protein